MAWKNNPSASKRLNGWERQRRNARVIRRQGAVCALCGSTERLEVDHKLALARGATEQAEANLRVLCHECNFRKALTIDRRPPRKRGPERHPGLLR